LRRRWSAASPSARICVSLPASSPSVLPSSRALRRLFLGARAVAGPSDALVVGRSALPAGGADVGALPGIARAAVVGCPGPAAGTVVAAAEAFADLGGACCLVNSFSSVVPHSPRFGARSLSGTSRQPSCRIQE
jgi:hypothetical protein